MCRILVVGRGPRRRPRRRPVAAAAMRDPSTTYFLTFQRFRRHELRVCPNWSTAHRVCPNGSTAHRVRPNWSTAHRVRPNWSIAHRVRPNWSTAHRVRPNWSTARERSPVSEIIPHSMGSPIECGPHARTHARTHALPRKQPPYGSRTATEAVTPPTLDIRTREAMQEPAVYSRRRIRIIGKRRSVSERRSAAPPPCSAALLAHARPWTHG